MMKAKMQNFMQRRTRSKTQKKQNRSLLPQLKAPKRLQALQYFFEPSPNRKMSENTNKIQVIPNSKKERKHYADQNNGQPKIGKNTFKSNKKKQANQCMMIQRILPSGLSTKKTSNQFNFIKFGSEQYQGQRDYNQDRILINMGTKILDKFFTFFGVFDGHGGYMASQYAKNNFVKFFQEQTNQFPLLNVLEILRKSINKLQIKICELSKNKIGIGGTCASILLICQNLYYIAHVGDSRILKIKNLNTKDEFQQLTTDHKPSQKNQRARIQSVGGKVYRSKPNIIEDNEYYGPYRVFPGKLSVSRSLGDYEAKKLPNGQALSWQPELIQGKIQQNTLFLIFSDGAYEKFENHEIVQYFTKTKNLEQPQIRKCLQTFFINSILRETIDNISLVVVYLKPNNLIVK